MPAGGTVTVRLSSEQAADIARWLTQDYVPLNPSDTGVASDLAKRLATAAKRRRVGPSFGLALPRALARWFAAFNFGSEVMRGWIEFSGKKRGGTDDALFQVQPCPPEIAAIARLFYDAVRPPLGRKPPSYKTLLERHRRLQLELQRHVRDPDIKKNRRRVRRKIKPLEMAADKTPTQDDP